MSHKLRYDKHYGLEFSYTNKSLIDKLSNVGYENSLYINALSFNNIDYLSLQMEIKYLITELGHFMKVD